MLSPDFNDLSIAECSSWGQNPELDMNLDSVEGLVNFDCTTATDMADFFTNLMGATETTSSQNQAPSQIFPAQAAAELKTAPNSGPSSEAVSFGAYDEIAAQLFGGDPTDSDLQQVATSTPVEPTRQGIGLGVFTHHDQAATEEPPIDPRFFDPMVLSLTVSQQPADSSDMEAPALTPAWQQNDMAATMDTTLAWGQDSQVVIPTSSVPGWGLNDSQLIMPTSSVEGLGQGNNQAVVPTTSTGSTLGWRPINQVVMLTSSASGWGQNSNQAVMPMSSGPDWGQNSDQVVVPTSSTRGWRPINQSVTPTSSAPGWGQNSNQVVMSMSSARNWGLSSDQAVMSTQLAPASGQRLMVSPEQHAHVPTKTLIHKQGKALGKQPAVYPPIEGYLALSRPPSSWGPSQAPYLFSYTKKGEWAPGLVFDTSDLVWYITNARRLANRPLRIWIQSSPSQYNTRYPNKHSTKCRWAGCPARKNSIVKGFYRVAFDERPQQSGTATDPFHNAGYMHLHCLEKIFDLFELVHCGIAAIDVRTLPYENGNEMAVGPHQELLLQAYKNWYRMHTAAYLHFDKFRDKSKMRRRHIPNEQRLWSVLTRVMVNVESKLRGVAAMGCRYGNALPNHLGDLDEHARLCRLGIATKYLHKEKKRGADEMDADPSTAATNGPQPKKAYHGSATTEAPSPALSHITVRVGGTEEEKEGEVGEVGVVEEEEEEEQRAACDAQAPGMPEAPQPWDQELRELGVFGFSV